VGANQPALGPGVALRLGLRPRPRRWPAGSWDCWRRRLDRLTRRYHAGGGSLPYFGSHRGDQGRASANVGAFLIAPREARAHRHRHDHRVPLGPGMRARVTCLRLTTPDVTAGGAHAEIVGAGAALAPSAGRRRERFGDVRASGLRAAERSKPLHLVSIERTADRGCEQDHRPHDLPRLGSLSYRVRLDRLRRQVGRPSARQSHAETGTRGGLERDLRRRDARR